MVAASWSHIQSVNRIRAWEMLLSKMRRSVGELLLVFDEFQRSFAQRVATAAIGGVACIAGYPAMAVIARTSSWLVITTECIFAVLSTVSRNARRVGRTETIGRITACSHTSAGTFSRHIQGRSSERIIGAYAGRRSRVRRRWKVLVQWFRIARCKGRSKVSSWSGLIAGLECGERIGDIGFGLDVLLVYESIQWQAGCACQEDCIDVRIRLPNSCREPPLRRVLLEC